MSNVISAWFSEVGCQIKPSCLLVSISDSVPNLINNANAIIFGISFESARHKNGFDER